jgi:PAS domain S-box-containing protein
MELSEGAFRDLISEVPTPLILVNENGHIVFANDHAVRLFGGPSGELQSQSIGALVPELRTLMEAATYRMLAEYPDGASSMVDICLRPVNGDFEPLLLVSIRECEASDSRLALFSRMVGGAVHDLNNYLGGILMYSAVVANKIDGEPVKKDIDEIAAAARAASEVVARLSAFAQVEVESESWEIDEPEQRS